MPLRVAITKQTASGEQFVTDVCQWNPVTGEIMHDDVSEMSRLADEMLKLADMRSMEMHTRMLEAYALREHCTPEVWYKIQSVLDILAGNISADTVARRWQSEVEENAELAAVRDALHDQEPQVLRACTLCDCDKPMGTFVMLDTIGEVCCDCASKLTPEWSNNAALIPQCEAVLQHDEDTHHCQECGHTMPQREYDTMVERSA